GGRRFVIPALFTRMWTAPNRSTTLRTISFTPAESATSSSNKIASPDDSRISSTVFCPAAGLRSATTTEAPALAIERPMSRPRPLPPPVTIATFPCRSNVMVAHLVPLPALVCPWNSRLQPRGGPRRNQQIRPIVLRSACHLARPHYYMWSQTLRQLTRDHVGAPSVPACNHSEAPGQ